MKKVSLMSSWCKRKGAKELRVSKIPSLLGANELPSGFQAYLRNVHFAVFVSLIYQWICHKLIALLLISCPGERWLKSLHPMGAMHSSLAVAAGTERHRLGESLGLRSLARLSMEIPTVQSYGFERNQKDCLESMISIYAFYS